LQENKFPHPAVVAAKLLARARQNVLNHLFPTVNREHRACMVTGRTSRERAHRFPASDAVKSSSPRTSTAAADAPAPYPFLHRPTLVLCMCNLSHFYAMTSLFAYVGFLCVDRGWAADRDAAGAVSGLLASAVFAGRIASSVPWGAAIARFGRRRAVLVSLGAIAAGQVRVGDHTESLCRTDLLRSAQ
jgi:hypothetical protein